MQTLSEKSSGKNLTERVLVIALFVYGWLSINIYLPALPSLTEYFHVQASDLKLSITLFFAGFGLSQLFWGPISEKYGRKNPLLLGLMLALIGTAITMSATSVFMFNSGRFIEAVGLGAAPVLGRAILIDVLLIGAFTSTMAYATITTNIIPAIAPVVGGNLLHWFGWRSIFLFLLIYGFLLLAFSYFYLSETHPHRQPNIKIGKTFKHYIEAFTNRKFLGFLMPYIIVSGAMLGYYTVTPFIFISKLHISAKSYGFLSLFTVITYVLGALANRFLSSYLDAIKMILFGIMMLLISAIVIVVASFLFSLNIFSVLIPMSIFTFAAGVICPTSNAAAMDVLRHKAGTAGAVIGFSLYASSAILSTIATALSLTSLLPLAIYIAMVALLTLVVFVGMVVLPN